MEIVDYKDLPESIQKRIDSDSLHTFSHAITYEDGDEVRYTLIDANGKSYIL